MGSDLKRLAAPFLRLERLASWLHRVANSVRRNPPRKTLENIASALEDARFEWTYGIETARHEQLKDMHISGVNKSLGRHYEPVRVRAFRKLMRHLRLPSNLVFIDIGSGKGRALIAAAEFPFRRVIGVEFSAELCSTSERNIAAAQRQKLKCTNIEVVHADAAEYHIPSDASVFFFFNPVKRPLMERILNNIQDSLEREPRRIWIIIDNPQELAPAVEYIFGNFNWAGEYTYGSAKFWVWSNGH